MSSRIFLSALSNVLRFLNLRNLFCSFFFGGVGLGGRVSECGRMWNDVMHFVNQGFVRILYQHYKSNNSFLALGKIYL